MIELVFVLLNVSPGRINVDDPNFHRKIFSTMDSCQVEEKKVLERLDRSKKNYIVSCRRIQE